MHDGKRIARTVDRTPRAWPAGVQFIAQLAYAPTLDRHLRKSLQSLPSVSAPPRGRSPPVRIRIITSRDHPACGQRGLFAASRLPPNAHIIDYLGEVHADARESSNFDLSLLRLPDGVSVGIDAQHMGNEARFVNDYRSIAPRPNAFFREGHSALGELTISLWSGPEGIKKADEILVSYGKAWWRARAPLDGPDALSDETPS